MRNQIKPSYLTGSSAQGPTPHSSSVDTRLANTKRINIDGAKVEITKLMASDPRRVGEIVVEFTFPKNNYTEEEKKILENSANHCPVAKSLHPDLIQTKIFRY